MYFCPKCDYTFDVTKSLIDSSNKKETVNSFKTILKKIKNKEDLTNVKLELNLSELEKDDKYIKLKESIKNKIKELINKNFPSTMKFKCLNCNFEKLITQTIRLYHLNLKVEDNISSIESNKVLVKDPILPRTKDYICKNINCITHKNYKIKEAIYIKNDSNYKLKYICTVCFTDWNLN